MSRPDSAAPKDFRCAAIGAGRARELRGGLEAPRYRVASLISKVRDGLRAYDVYVSALLLFVASRIVVVVGINFGKLLQPSSIAEQWDAGNAWYDRLLRWDAGWYRSIVDSGYQYSDDPGSYSSTVFYPLYPLVSYFTKTLFGVDAFAALLLVANVSAIAATMLMAKVVKDEAGRDVAVLTVAFFCFFPSSLFLSSGYSESLFLALALLGFLFLQSEAYVFAAISAGFSAATRPTGIVMIPVILIDMALRSRLARPELLPRMALCGLLAALGLLIYMAFLQLEFERPFAFVAGQSAWNQGTFLDRFVAGATLRTLLHSRFLGNGGLFLTFLGLAVACLRCFRFRFPLYALETLALPYFTLGVTSSMERFVLVCFPAFMCLAVLCKQRPWLAHSLIGISGALLLRESALFSQWYLVG